MNAQEMKKQYTKPEVTKHGNVEELTNFVNIGGSSSPVAVNPPTFSFPLIFQLRSRT